MRICKQVKFITGDTLDDLQAKLNEALREGAELKAIDIATLTGAVVVTEYVGEIEKTLLDELEDALGCHNCEECPFYEKPTDGRKKWSICGKGKRVQATSGCCVAYYETLREEEESEISKDQRNDGLLRRGGRGRGGVAESLTDGGLQQTQRAFKVPSFRKGVFVKIPEDSNRRIIQGGARC